MNAQTARSGAHELELELLRQQALPRSSVE
jgi:hypothetical protein